MTFKDIDILQASSHAGVPNNPTLARHLGRPRRDGEVWRVTLWDAPARLINKLGFTNGNQLIPKLVTHGRNLSPPNPTFLQARDGILLADRVNNSRANLTELWQDFAKRGMGYSACSPRSLTTVGVVGVSDLPPNVSNVWTWTFQTSGAITSSPAIGGGGTIYVGSSDGKLYAINPNGTLKWQFASTNALTASPVWFNKSPPVNLPQNCFVVDPSNPNIIYSGSNIGVLQSIDGGESWTHMGPEIGLPNVAVFDLQINRTTQRLVAFTHGRGAFAMVPLNADTDGDGFSDLQELIAGTDPNDSRSFLKINHITVELGQPVIQFDAVSNRTYSVQFKNSWSAASWLTLSDVEARLTNRVETVRDTNTLSAKRLYRLVTSKQQ